MNDEICRSVKVLAEEDLSKIVDDLYLLKNNTFLKQVSDMTNNEYKILNFIMAKMQKSLLQEYPTVNNEIVESLPDAIRCSITKKELTQLNIRLKDITGKKLGETFTTLNKRSVKYVSYITGKYTIASLVPKIEFSDSNRYVDVTLYRDVFMFLIDYNLDYDFKKSIENKKSKNKTMNLKSKGYSKIAIKISKEFKSRYTQSLFEQFKVDYEKEYSKNPNCTKIIKYYEISVIRDICGVGDKYNKGNKIKKYVIDIAVNELLKKEYMHITYIEELTPCSGGKKLTGITFTIKPLQKLIDILPKRNIKVDCEETTDNKPTETNKVQTLEEELNDKLVLNRIRLSINTLREFINTYGDNLVKRAATSLIMNNEEKRVRAPKMYMLKTLENMQTKLDAELKSMESGEKVKQLSFHNFEPREYDYDVLENKLLGWDKDEDEDVVDIKQ